MFCSDYPRGFANCFWFWWFPAPHPLSVMTALAVAFLFARHRRPVRLLGLPAGPLPRCAPAALAAIALACLLGMKALLASFKQTAPHARPTCQSLPIWPSSGTTSALRAGSARCNSAGVLAGDESVARIL